MQLERIVTIIETMSKGYCIDNCVDQNETILQYVILFWEMQKKKKGRT